MKRFFAVVILFLVFTLLCGVPVETVAQDTGWVIDSFSSEVFIPKDGKVRVTEIIEVDFKNLQKHGIYRTIDTENIKFKLSEVKQDGGEAQREVTKSSDEVTIKIGDPDLTITGQHTYEISYEVGKVISRFEDHDEFYWDVTGNDWPVPVEEVVATVTLEGESQLENVVCYTGAFSMREWDCVASMEAGVARFETTASLPLGYGLTIVHGFSKGLVDDPVYAEDIYKPLWAVLGSLVAVAFVFRRWWKHGRDMWYRKHVILDPKAKADIKPLFAKQTVVPEFDPPEELRPAEVGTLIDERVDIHDISATIVDLAVRGYLKIGEDKKGRRKVYWFEKLKEFEMDGKLAEYEKEILRGLFDDKEGRVELVDLKNKFYKRLEKIKDLLYEQMKEEGYFVRRPDKVKEKYIGLGMIILVISGILASFTNWLLLWLFAPAVVLGALLLIMSPLMPKKMAKGTEAVRRASGFKLFISKAEKHRQQFNERINRFDEFLPYAMVFGVVGKWVKVYEKLGVEPPQPGWYVAPYAFNAGAFSSSMTGMSSAFASTLPSTPASAGGGSGFGGGGFSGGGFGGGGGGSW